MICGANVLELETEVGIPLLSTTFAVYVLTS